MEMTKRKLIDIVSKYCDINNTEKEVKISVIILVLKQ